ncbi:unnamed protein product [Cunninghamella blakesleeana]
MAHTELIQTQYNKALRYYLLTKYNHAATTCVKALEQIPVVNTITIKQDEYDTLRVQLWILYLNTLTITLINNSNNNNNQALSSRRLIKQFGLPLSSAESFELVTLSVWDLVLKNHGNIAGNCDPRIISAYLMTTLKLNVPTIGRQIAEQWFATLSDNKLDHLSSFQGQEDTNDVFMISYLELIDVYSTRTLPESNDFESAKSFIEYNSFISDEKKESILGIIQTIRDDQQKEQEKKKKLELQKKEAEKAAQLAKQAAIEKERQQKELEKEKMRLEAEQLRKQQQKEKERQQQQQSVSSSTTTRSTSSSERSLSSTSTPKTVSEQSLQMVKSWMNQLTTTGSTAYVAVLIVFFALLSLLRGPRSRLSNVLKLVLTKFWQTIQMGTKVTYM